MSTVADHVYISVFPPQQKSHLQVSNPELASRNDNAALSNVCSCTIKAYMCGLCMWHKQASKLKAKHQSIWDNISFYYSLVRII